MLDDGALHEGRIGQSGVDGNDMDQARLVLILMVGFERGGGNLVGMAII